MRTVWLLVLIGCAGCFDFRKDLAACQASGHCVGEAVDADGGAHASDGGTSETRFCGSGNWCWDVAPRSTIKALLTVAPDEAWAAGPDGLLLHFDGRAWQPIAGAPRANFKRLARTPEGLFYLGADEGLFRFDGGTFEPLSGPPRVDSVVTSARGQVAVAANGKLCLVSGATCVIVTPPAFEPLGLAFTETNDLLAVGTVGRSAKASVDTLQWTSFTPVVTTDLYQVLSVSAGEAWAAGAGGSLLHLVGSTWRAETSSLVNTVDSLSATSPSDVWAADGNENLAHWNGTLLQASRLPASFETSALSVAGSTGWLGGTDGHLLRLQAGAFVPTAQGTFERITALHARTADDVWACTQAGEVLHRTKRGGAFGLERLQPRPLWGIFAVSETEVWATGEGGAWRFDGSAWTHVVEGRTYGLVTQTRDGTVWLAGDDISTVSGSTTVIVRPGPTPSLDSIATRGDTMLLGTTGGEILECTRAGCTVNQGPTTFGAAIAATPGALFVAERSSVWMKQGTGSWVMVGTDPSTFSAMSGDGADGVYALASGGRLYHFDGAGALRSKTTIPTEVLLRSLTVTDSGRSITVAGYSGALLTHEGALP